MSAASTPPSGPSVGRTTNTENPADEPMPLSAFVNGVLHLLFAAGASIDLKTTQEAALGFLAIDDGERASDGVTWRSGRWFSWDDQQIVFSSFDTDKDQNWEISPAERRELADAGHPHGVIASVLDYWKRQTRGTEPTYSVRAIVALHQFARHGASKEAWEAAARIFEGQHGADKLARAARRTSPAPSTTPADQDTEPEEPSIVADDDAPCDDAPDGNAATTPYAGPTHPEAGSEAPDETRNVDSDADGAEAHRSTRDSGDEDAEGRPPGAEDEPEGDDPRPPIPTTDRNSENS